MNKKNIYVKIIEDKDYDEVSMKVNDFIRNNEAIEAEVIYQKHPVQTIEKTDSEGSIVKENIYVNTAIVKITVEA